MIVVGELSNFRGEDLDARIAIEILGSAPHAKTAVCALVGAAQMGHLHHLHWTEQDIHKRHVKFKDLVLLYLSIDQIL